MAEISSTVNLIKDICSRYGLKVLYMDCTDITMISRIGFSHDVFIQVYANVKKEKINLALVVAGARIYGVDKEGGFYHEHSFDNPLSHIEAEQTNIETFVMNSLELLKRMNLI